MDETRFPNKELILHFLKYVSLTKSFRLDLNNLRAFYLAYNFIEEEHIFFYYFLFYINDIIQINFPLKMN